MSTPSRYTFTSHLKELRFHLCQTSPQSQAARSFLTRAYPTMKRNNPETPILIREASGIAPRVWARYEWGREEVRELDGLSDQEIEDAVGGLVREGAAERKPSSS